MKCVRLIFETSKTGIPKSSGTCNACYFPQQDNTEKIFPKNVKKLRKKI